MALAEKHIKPTFEYAGKLINCEIADFHNFPISLQNVSLIKQETGIVMDCSASTRDLWGNSVYEAIPQFSFKANAQEFVVPENSAFITSPISCSSNDYQPATFQLNQFYSSHIDWEKPLYLRSIQPLEKVQYERDFCTFWYQEGRMQSSGMMEVDFKEYGKFQLYPYKYKSRYYLICDALFPIDWECFNKMAFAAQLALGLFTQNVTLEEAYIFGYDSHDMLSPLGVYYMKLRPSIRGQYHIFTTNMYWLDEALKTGEANAYARKMLMKEVDGSEALDTNLVNWLDMSFYSNMTNEIFANDIIQRAVGIVIEASVEPLEYQAVMYAVALEYITTFLSKKHSAKSQPLVDKNVFKKFLIPQIEEILNRASEEGKIEDEAKRILQKKLYSWNNPTNSGKLESPFAEFGYNLTDIDHTAIQQRNSLIHGYNKDRSDMEAFYDELYRNCIRLHKLCCILLLKHFGFDSKIINIPVLRDFPEECTAHQPILIDLEV